MKLFKNITKKVMTLLLTFLMLLTSFMPFSFHMMEVEAIDNNTYGIVYFRTKGCGTNTNYTVDGIGRAGYTNGCYGADAAFLGYNSDKTKVKFKLAGVTGWVNASDVRVYDYYNNFESYYTSSYLIENGLIKHVFSTDIFVYGDADKVTLGPAPSYLKEGQYYWSYDGHYFYNATREGYKTMIIDYRNGNYNNSINKSNPFYSYYQYLTHRSMSNYTGKDLASYFTSIGIRSNMTSYPATSGQSLFYGQQTSFVQYQNEFGANLGLVFGVARNESATGTSNIAFYGKNLFGHSAFDSSPGASATSYLSVAQSIYAHDKFYVSEGYLDPCDGRSYAGSYNESTCNKGRYFGGHAGDKNSGMNVKYASDPYWGEKMAQFYYLLDSAKGLQDYNKYTIALKQNSSSVGIYKDASNTSTLLYKSGKVADYPVIVLEEVTGQSINGNNKWYKIQTDPVINSARTSIVQDSGYYDYENNYGYVHSSGFIKINSGKATKKRYKITFDPNGGTFTDGITAKKVLSVEQNVVPEINAPTKTGDTFMGWSSTVMGASSNVTYVAQWKNSKYDITFNANGGKFNDGTSNKKLSVAAGTKPTIDTPTRDGYTFKGWDKNIVNATGNTTYTAIWEKNKVYYDVTFDALGGTFGDSTSKKVVKVEEGITPEVENPTRSGYVFEGWTPEVTTATANGTYKAIWKKLYKVTLNADGGKFKDGSETKSLEIKEGETPQISETPTKTGYTFVSWNKEITSISENTTYTALWEKVPTYNIVFDANEGTFKNGKTTKEVETSKGDVPTVSEKPTREGYIFVGWEPEIIGATQNTTYKAVWREGTVEDVLTKKDGLFYFNYLKENNGSLQLQGYQTITGINNNLEEDIKYEIIFEDIDTGEEVRTEATRITKSSEIPKKVYSPDGKDYTYSWFNFNLDIDQLENGNYKMYVVAYNDAYYSKSIINNKTYNNQVTKYKGNKKATMINNNYDNSTSFIELKVRDELIAEKNGSYVYNQYDKYTEFSFNNNGTLHIRGNSYSYGMDLSASKAVSRNIIFENTETYKTYSKSLGSITNGNYKVVLPVSDKLDKTRAWYDANIDLSSIPVGKYVIYITTTSNVTDVLEFTEKLGRSLSTVKKDIDGKTYSFSINKKRGNRIEMTVEKQN